MKVLQVEVGACHVGSLKTKQQTPKVKSAVKSKEECFCAWLTYGMLDDYSYWQAKQSAALAVARTNTLMWEQLSERILTEKAVSCSPNYTVGAGCCLLKIRIYSGSPESH